MRLEITFQKSSARTLVTSSNCSGSEKLRLNLRLSRPASMHSRTRSGVAILPLVVRKTYG